MSKKWCQYCRINIDYNRDAIRKHQQTRLHIQNKEKQINHQRRLAKKQHKNTSTSTLVFQSKTQDSTNQPVKVSEAQEKRQLINRMKAQVMDSVKSKLHSFIAQKTHGKFGANIQYPQQIILVTQKHHQPENNNSDCSDSQNVDENSDSDDFKMWRIQTCSQTKKPCFINNITGVKLYEKPIGVILTEQEQNQWQRLLKQQKQNPQQQQQVNIGQWQQVNQDQDIFVANAVKEDEEQDKHNESEQDSQIQQNIEELRKKLLDSNTIADKSRMMKRLVQTGKQQTFDMKSFQQQKQQIIEKKDEDDDLKKMRGFIPRKRVKGLTILGKQQWE